MKLSSNEALAATKKALSLGDVSDELDRCLRFHTGRALIVGPWADQRLRIFCAAARRTEEGGRNLRPKHWANAEPKVKRDATMRTNGGDAAGAKEKSPELKTNDKDGASPPPGHVDGISPGI